MSRILTAFVLFAILVLAGGVILHSQNTPEYALRRIGEAIETRDAVLLERHVDIDAVIGAAVDDMLAQPAATPATGCGADAVPHTRAELLALVRDTVLSAFLSGTAPGGGNADVGSVRRDGRSARATVRIDRPQPDSSLVLELLLEKRAAEWTLVAIANAPGCISAGAGR